MSTVKKIIRLITDPLYRFEFKMSRGVYKSMPDEQFLRLYFKKFFGRELDLEEPKTICEKIQWLKLYNRRPEYTMMVDKYEVKKYVASVIGEEHVVPLYGVWDSFDEIDFDKLPDQFVLKVTHDCAGLIICKNKAELNIDEAREKINKALAHNYYLHLREWAYKDVKPRIIAEKYIESLGAPDKVEYKTTCFGGKFGFSTLCMGVAHSTDGSWTNDHFDRDFNRVPFMAREIRRADREFTKPEGWEELIEMCEKLAKGIPYVRVDGYLVDGKFYFGELTFYTWGGFMRIVPEEWDRKLGDMITLPPKYNS